MTEAAIEAALPQTGKRDNDRNEFPIEPENRDTVRLYLGLATQWRTETVVGGRIVFTRVKGLDYSAVAPAAAGLGISLTPDVWGGLQTMEREALAIYRRREDAALRRA